MGKLFTLFDSDNGNTVPQSVSGLVLWYDANHSASITKDGSNNVSVWANRASPDTYDALQTGTATAQPDYVASGINGLPVIRIDGTNSYFTLGNTLNTIIGGQDRQLTIVSVIRPDATNGYRVILGKTGSSPDKQFVYTIQDGVGGLYTAFNTSGSEVRQVNGNQTISTSNATILSITYDGTVDTNNGLDRVDIYTNGVLNGKSLKLNAGSLTDSINAGAAHVGLGSVVDNAGLNPSTQFDGDIGEFLLYRRQLSAPERELLEGYLTEKWGIS